MSRLTQNDRPARVWAQPLLLAALAVACTQTNTVADGSGGVDSTAGDDTGAGSVECPIDDYPELSPDCQRFLDNPTDGLQVELNRTTACSDPPPLGAPAETCWDDGTTGTERYVGFCINVDDLGICVPGHLGIDPTGSYVVWDDQIECIDGEVSVTTDGARTCVPLCSGQSDGDVGSACAGGRVCTKLRTDVGEVVVCGGQG